MWSVLISESVPVVTNIHHFLVLSAGIVSHIAECVNIYPEMRTFLIFYGTTPQISVLYLLSHIICVSNWFINKVRWLCDYVYCLSASSSFPRIQGTCCCELWVFCKTLVSFCKIFRNVFQLSPHPQLWIVGQQMFYCNYKYCFSSVR